MQIQEMVEQLNGIFREVLDNDGIMLSEKTTAADIEEWDSLTHIQLVVATEKHFKVRLTSSEIQSFKNVGDMCRAIQEKLTK